MGLSVIELTMWIWRAMGDGLVGWWARSAYRSVLLRDLKCCIFNLHMMPLVDLDVVQSSLTFTTDTFGGIVYSTLSSSSQVAYLLRQQQLQLPTQLRIMSHLFKSLLKDSLVPHALSDITTPLISLSSIPVHRDTPIPQQTPHSNLHICVVG